VFDLGFVVQNLDMSQNFTVYRSSGSWVKGRWTEGGSILKEMRGVISVANQKELNALPEGDRIKGGMIFHSTEELFTTRTGTDMGTSDKILWNGEYYRMYNVWPYKDYGFWKAIGARIKGE